MSQCRFISFIFISSAGCCGFNSGRVCTPIKKEKVNVYAAVIRVKRSCDDASCSAEIDKDNLRKVSYKSHFQYDFIMILSLIRLSI